jgi:hypothetical protein
MVQSGYQPGGVIDLLTYRQLLYLCAANRR